MNPEDQNALIFGIAVGAALYFLPTIIAMLRRHPSGGGIFALNLFLGWTFLGWLGALVWALSSTKIAQQTVVVNNVAPVPASVQSGGIMQGDLATIAARTQIQIIDTQCPICAETIKAAAKKCRFCGEIFTVEVTKNSNEYAEWEEVKEISFKKTTANHIDVVQSGYGNVSNAISLFKAENGDLNPWIVGPLIVLGVILIFIVLSVIAALSG